MGFTTTGQSVKEFSQINGTWDNSLKERNFYADSSRSKTIFFPASEYLKFSNGEVGYVSSVDCPWAAVLVNQKTGFHLRFTSTNVNPLDRGNRVLGFGVRSSQE